MLAQRRPDEQVYVGPTSVSNVGPTESTTEKLRWSNGVMLSGIYSPLTAALKASGLGRHTTDSGRAFHCTTARGK